MTMRATSAHYASEARLLFGGSAARKKLLDLTYSDDC